MSDAVFHLLLPGRHLLLRNVDPRRILLAKERVSLYVILKLALRARALYTVNRLKLLRMGLYNYLCCLFAKVIWRAVIKIISLSSLIAVVR